MTFDEWYFKAVGITVEQAKRVGVYDLNLIRQCWNAATVNEREEIIAAIPGGSVVDPQWICDMIRDRAK